MKMTTLLRMLPVLLLTLLPHGRLAAQGGGWRYAGCPDGGSVEYLASLPSGEIFAATYLGPIFRSLDDGRSWDSVIMDRGFARGARCFFGGGSNPLYMVNGGLLTSTDRGAHWTWIVTPSLPRLYRGALDSSGAILVCSDREVFRSSDGGASWRRVMSAEYSGSHVVAAPDGWAYVAFGGYLYSSSDGGVTWKWTAGGGIGPLIGAFDRTLYAVTVDGNVRKSTDHGAHWTSLDLYVGGDEGMISISVRGELLARNPLGKLLVSRDEGSTWSAVVTPEKEQILSATITGTGCVLVGLRSIGVIRSDAGGAWARSSRGMVASGIGAISAGLGGDLHATIGDFSRARYARSTDAGRTWTDIGLDAESMNDSDFPLPILSTFAGALVAVTDQASRRIARSTDRGATWQYPESNLAGNVMKLSLTPDGAIHASVAGSGLYRSTDDGASWSQFRAAGGDTIFYCVVQAGDRLVVPFSYRGPSGRQYAAMHLSPTSGAVVAITEVPAILDDVVVTPDGTLIGVGAWAAFGQVVLSTDRGTTWRSWPDPKLGTTLEIAIDSAGRVFAGMRMSPKVAVTTDAGASWSAFAEIPDGRAARMFATDPRGVVYAATDGGVYEYTPAAAVSSEAGAGEAKLEGIAPNPASDEATLRLRLDRDARVSLRVFDRLGRQGLATRDFRLGPGLHAIPIDIASLPPGVYLCSVSSGSRIWCERFVIAR